MSAVCALERAACGANGLWVARARHFIKRMSIRRVLPEGSFLETRSTSTGPVRLLNYIYRTTVAHRRIKHFVVSLCEYELR